MCIEKSKVGEQEREGCAGGTLECGALVLVLHCILLEGGSSSTERRTQRARRQGHSRASEDVSVVGGKADADAALGAGDSE